MGLARVTLDQTDIPREEAQRSVGGDRRVELSQRSSRRITRVREERFPGLSSLAVQFVEVRFAHVDLAARFEHVGNRVVFDLAQLEWDVAHGANIGGHVFAGGPVAAGGASFVGAAPVKNRHRAAVDLRLSHELDVTPPSEPVDAFRPLPQLFLAIDVAQAQHGDLVPYRAKG